MRTRFQFAALSVVLLSTAVGTSQAQTAISADGVVESTTGGFKFPDGTVQTTAVVGLGSAPVEDTGLDATQCFDENGLSRDCTGTGEDGEHQAGGTWPTPRFTDNGDGTITDNHTGLIWLEDANCTASATTWQEALDWVDDLNTTAIACTNYTAMTFIDWRLPTIKELLSLVDYGEGSPALPSSQPFTSVKSYYWSSSSALASQSGTPTPFKAWVLSTNPGRGGWSNKIVTRGWVWPVRRGAVLSGALARAGEAQAALSADGVVESTTGGFEFPDGTVQTSAAAPSGSAPVEETGLDATQCFDEWGNSRDCTGTGEDGEYQAGETLPEPRFTDNGDGTVADVLTGLIWLQDADCPGSLMPWQEALDWVEDLNTTAVACTNYAAMTFTDWRLPNIKELLSLVDYGRTPAIPRNRQFTNVKFYYWSSSSYVKSPSNAWILNITAGSHDRDFSKTTRTLSVWPVRGGR